VYIYIERERERDREVVFLNFEVWVADRKVFDVRFDFSMSKSPRGQVLSRFGWIGDGFIRVDCSNYPSKEP